MNAHGIVAARAEDCGSKGGTRPSIPARLSQAKAPVIEGEQVDATHNYTDFDPSQTLSEDYAPIAAAHSVADRSTR
jgi:hypothetical protein